MHKPTMFTVLLLCHHVTSQAPLQQQPSRTVLPKPIEVRPGIWPGPRWLLSGWWGQEYGTIETRRNLTMIFPLEDEGDQHLINSYSKYSETRSTVPPQSSTTEERPNALSRFGGPRERHKDICSHEGELCESPGNPWMACCSMLYCVKEATAPPFTLRGVDKKFIWGRCQPVYPQVEE